MADKTMVKEFEHQGKTVEVYVSYNVGGVNCFSGRMEPRGYWLHVQPVIKENRGNGIVVRSFGGFTGVKKFLFEVGRKSAKQMQKAVDMVDDTLIESMLAQCKFE